MRCGDKRKREGGNEERQRDRGRQRVGKRGASVEDRDEKEVNEYEQTSITSKMKFGKTDHHN